MTIPMPNTTAAISSKNTLAMRKYRSPFMINDGNGDGSCGRARESRAGSCTSFCHGWRSIHIPRMIGASTYMSGKYTQRMQHYLQRHERPKERLRDVELSHLDMETTYDDLYTPHAVQRALGHQLWPASPKRHLDRARSLFNKHLRLFPQYEHCQQRPHAHEVQQWQPFLQAGRWLG